MSRDAKINIPADCRVLKIDEMTNDSRESLAPSFPLPYQITIRVNQVINIHSGCMLHDEQRRRVYHSSLMTDGDFRAHLFSFYFLLIFRFCAMR